MKVSKEYKTWTNMRSRCNNSKHPDYRYYGGRGIKVCARWDNFDNFYSDMGDKPEGLTLDRIDNDGNYEPNNCRWATKKEQIANRGALRNNTSGYENVHWYKRDKNWRVSMVIDGETKRFAGFKTVEEAAAKVAEIKLNERH